MLIPVVVKGKTILSSLMFHGNYFFFHFSAEWIKMLAKRGGKPSTRAGLGAARQQHRGTFIHPNL